MQIPPCMMNSVGSSLLAVVLAFSLAFVASLKPQRSLWLASFYAIASGLFVVGLARTAV
jgi:hypothetical protein